MGMFKQHIHQLLRLDPARHFRDLETRQRREDECFVAKEHKKGSFARKLFRLCFLRRSRHQSESYTMLRHPSRTELMKQTIRRGIRQHSRSRRGSLPSERLPYARKLRSAALTTTRSIYGVVVLGLVIVLGVALLALSISWNTLPPTIIPFPWKEILQCLSVLFQIMFGYVTLFVWDADSIFAYTDLATTIIAPLADWYWSIRYKVDSHLDPAQITMYCCITMYMTVRLWMHIARSRNESLRDLDHDLERLDIVWACRSAPLVSKLYPEFAALWDEFVSAYGYVNACAVCSMSIYVTDPDPDACKALYQEVKGTSLFQSGCVHVGRPNFASIIEDHSIGLVCTRRTSSTLLFHVGSEALAREIHQCKLLNDVNLALTGNKKHTMEYVTDNYGGASRRPVGGYSFREDEASLSSRRSFALSDHGAVRENRE